MAPARVDPRVISYYRERTQEPSCQRGVCAIEDREKRWGPAFWRVLYTVAAQYPDSPTPEARHAHESFLVTLTAALPCPACRANFARHAKRCGYAPHEDTDVFDSKQRLFRFVYDVHRATSRDIGKPWRYGRLAAARAHHTLA